MSSRIILTPAGLLLLLLAGNSALASDDARQLATDYCRQHPRSIQLNDDKTVLCFDRDIAKNSDLSLFRDLRENGYFVVRSVGGYSEPAIGIADLLRARNAEV